MSGLENVENETVTETTEATETDGATQEPDADDDSTDGE